MDLRWSWLGAPYFACAALMAAVAVATALTRGDRVMRLAVLGTVSAALPWALCQGLAACTDDPATALGLLRLGQGTVALVGPGLLLILLGASGQLERYRWVARFAGLVGAVLAAICWATPWTVPSARRLSSGMLWTGVGPLTGVHVSMLALWLAVGYLLARRATPHGQRKRTTRLVLFVLVLGAITSLDTLLLYGVWDTYPIAWLPSSIAAGLGVVLVMRTELIAPQGIDRGVALEVAALAIAGAGAAGLALALGTASPIALAAVAALVWVAATAIAWAIARARPVRIADERALESFVSRATAGDERKLADRLYDLWKGIGLHVDRVWRRDGDAFAEVGGKQRWPIAAPVADWLSGQRGAIAEAELGTIRIGALRPQIEALYEAHGATLVVPLVDRDELVGVVEATCARALRDEERGLVLESSRAVARALTFFSLARAASRERGVAREVEVADALRAQASANRDAELGRWVVTAEYRAAPRTTGAGWSAVELANGRLAVLVTEAQAHGVAAALATAALTGAFAAATDGAEQLSIDDLLRSMHASAEGVIRGGEPVAAFFALLDPETRVVDWACAGHPGGVLVGPIAVVEHGLPAGSGRRARPDVVLVGARDRDPSASASLAVAARGRAELPADTLLVIASTAVRDARDDAWRDAVREAAPTGGRLATALVDRALDRGEPREDLLAVVVRSR